MKFASVLLVIFTTIAGCAHPNSESPTTKPIAAAIIEKKPVEKPPIVAAGAWGSKPQPIDDSRKHAPQWITIHHAGEMWLAKKTPDQYVRDMQAWGQREKHWPDLPYHFLIAPDGRIFEGRPLIYEPDTNTKYVLAGNIGVEMMGNFERQRPSPQQIESCAKLVAWLCENQNIAVDHIRGHKDAAPNQTDCPGKDFYRYLQSGEFKQWVTDILDGKAPRINPGPPLEGGPTGMIPVSAPTTKPIT